MGFRWFSVAHGIRTKGVLAGETVPTGKGISEGWLSPSLLWKGTSPKSWCSVGDEIKYSESLERFGFFFLNSLWDFF